MVFYQFHKYIQDKYSPIWRKEINVGEGWNKKSGWVFLDKKFWTL